MFEKKSRIWGMYAVLLAAFALLTLLIPSEPTRVFFTAFIGTAVLFPIAAIDTVLMIRRQQARKMKLRWPDMFTMLVIQLIFFAFLDMGSVFCPFYIAIIAELIVYVATLFVVFGEEKLREAVRWLYRHRKGVAVILLIAVLAVPAVYFGAPFVRYEMAASKMEKGEFVEAAEMFKELADFRDAENQFCESMYRLGKQLNEAGEHEQAYFALQDITEYEGVQAYIEENAELAAVRDRYGAYSVDNVVVLGEWNGQPMEWLVLDQQGSRRLLFAAKSIGNMVFNDEFKITYWENCWLREWLNGEFLNEAFSDAERAKMVETAVKNDDNAMYRVEAGEDTVDRLFLLSIDEAEQYRQGRMQWFRSDAAVWLRSPGCSRIDAAHITMGGGVDRMGTNIDKPADVRPVMWIDILDPAE